MSAQPGHVTFSSWDEAAGNPLRPRMGPGPGLGGSRGQGVWAQSAAWGHSAWCAAVQVCMHGGVSLPACAIPAVTHTCRKVQCIHSCQHTGTLSHKAPAFPHTAVSAALVQDCCASKGSSKGQQQPCMAQMQKLRHRATPRAPWLSTSGHGPHSPPQHNFVPRPQQAPRTVGSRVGMSQ